MMRTFSHSGVRGRILDYCRLVKNAFCGSLGLLVIGSISLAGMGQNALAKEKLELAKWSVENGGYFQNRKLKNQLNLIFNEDKEFFDSSDIEDAALILISYLEGEGYLAAKAIGEITLANGEKTTVEWDRNFDIFLPRDTSAKLVRFKLLVGPRFYYDTILIDSSQVLTTKEVEAFFYKEPMLFQNKNSRLFSNSLLQRSRGHLQTHLNTQGYTKARVKAELVESNRETGACTVRVSISEGPKHLVDSVEVNVLGNGPAADVDLLKYKGQPYSRFITQDVSREIRNRYYELGYPDTAIKSALSIEEGTNGLKQVRIVVDVTPGSQVFVSSISYSGSKNTKPSLIRSRLSLEEGELLNPSLLERSRLNLSRLGIFDQVDYDLIPEGENQRAIHFNLNERTTWEVDTIVGWGSYEQLRGGFQIEKLNMLGMGHRARFKTVVSLKSQLGEFRYLVPTAFGTPVSASAKAFGLKREEIAFEREDFGINFGLSRKFEKLGLDASTVYSIRTLEVRDNVLIESLANQEGATVGSFELRLGRDRRDNAINPKEGYRVSSQWEWASKAFGGEVDFQRAEFGLSYHNEISRGLYWHGNFTHGVVGSITEAQKQVPASVLYYPGGENSVRGYQRSEAAPREGEKFKGAQSFVLVNLEIEQSFSNSLSLVLFLDALGTASRIEEYPFNDTLASLGLGIRFKTFMGPVRLEYGHNLNPRDFDPKGTLHFALGYPF